MVLQQINKLLATIDFQISRRSYTPFRAFLERLKISGIPIQVIWDVGAFKGDWTRETKRYFPHSRFLLFEPNAQHNKYLEKISSEYHNFVLGKVDGEITFFSHGGTGDSIYPEFNESLNARSESRLVKCRTIDTLTSAAKSFPQPDFLKLDVQGAEIDVLTGAAKTIKVIKVILLECPIVHYNWGSPNIHEYLEFMFRHDFIPFFVTEVHRLQQIVTQIDIAFVSRGHFESKISALKDVGFWESTRMKYQN